MILRACFSILVLVHLSAAQCTCYNDQTAAPVYTPAGPRDNQTYLPCYPTGGSCLYVAKTNNESVSLCNIQFINFYSPTNSPMRIVIKDGSETVFDLVPADLQDPAIVAKLANFTSKTSELDVTMTVSNPNDGQINFYFYPCLKPVIPTLPPTTPAQTYPTVPGAPSQPALIGADIAFAFVSAGTDPTLFKNMKDAIIATVNPLNVVQWKDNPMGVRLGLLAPSNTDKPNTFGDQWNLDPALFTTFVGVLPQMIGISTSRWAPALDAFLGNNGYFDPKPANDHKPRANVQKIFVFFTQSSPSEDLSTLKTSLVKLATLDVHMVVVDARTGQDPVFTALLADTDITNFAFMNLQGSNDFLFKYVLQSDIDTAYGCTPKEKNLDIPTGSPGLSLSWPLTYGTAQYCNNQDSVLNLVSKDTKTQNLCVSVPSYELETEADYLRFYDANGKEWASFTGIDVVGSSFLIPGNQTIVTFKTNENTIYKGVTFTITATSSTCP